MSAAYDLASLAKPLVTAPLALAFLDLDADRRFTLGFHHRDTPLTVRQLLSHSSGLPPWRPYTGEPLATQLERAPGGSHGLLRDTSPGLATYSDLNYRLLAELLEAETGVPFQRLGAASGLSPFPWRTHPAVLPAGPDLVAWGLCTPAPPPPAAPGLPHDCNARAGMRGHAGFAATPAQLETALGRWVGAGWPKRMAHEEAEGEEGSRWGLGLQVAFQGPGQLGSLLATLPLGTLGVRVQADSRTELPPPAPPLGPKGAPSGWWYHLGYTGPALFFRPADQACLALLLHRLGPSGELLDAETLRARRWQALAAFMGECQG